MGQMWREGSVSMFAVRLRIFVDTGWPDSTIRDSIASSHPQPQSRRWE